MEGDSELGFVNRVQGGDGAPRGRGRLCATADRNTSSALEILSVEVLWDVQVSERSKFRRKIWAEDELGHPQQISGKYKVTGMTRTSQGGG